MKKKVLILTMAFMMVLGVLFSVSRPAYAMPARFKVETSSSHRQYPAKIKRVELNRSSLKLSPGKGATLTAKIIITSSVQWNKLNPGLTWRSSNSGLVKVDGGKVTVSKNAKKGSTATISVTSSGDNSKRDTCKIIVK